MVEHQGYAIESDAPIVYVTQVLVDAPAAAANSNGQEWECPMCTLLNSVDLHYCEACQNPGPILQDSELGGMVQTISFDDAGGNNQVVVAFEEDDEYQAKVEGSYGYNNGEIYEVEEVVDLGESPWGKKMRRRRRRKGRVCAGAVGGAVIGGVLGCGVGAVAGALVGGAIARNISKRGERKKDERIAQQQLLQSMD